MDFLPSWVPISSMAVQKPCLATAGSGGVAPRKLGFILQSQIRNYLGHRNRNCDCFQPFYWPTCTHTPYTHTPYTHTHPAHACVFVAEQPREEKREHLTDLTADGAGFYEYS